MPLTRFVSLTRPVAIGAACAGMLFAATPLATAATTDQAPPAAQMVIPAKADGTPGTDVSGTTGAVHAPPAPSGMKIPNKADGSTGSGISGGVAPDGTKLDPVLVVDATDADFGPVIKSGEAPVPADANSAKIPEVTVTGEHGPVVKSGEAPVPADANSAKVPSLLSSNCAASADPAVTFTDIAGNEHEDAIVWFAGQHITQGWTLKNGDHEYRPLEKATREAIAEFFYKAACEPAIDDATVATELAKFSDVTIERGANWSEHAKAIAWMAHEGITTGWPDGTFRPKAATNRDALAAFLFRASNAADLTADEETAALQAFTDVSADKDADNYNLHHSAIAWMAQEGISRGWNDKTYRPLTPVARDAIAAFFQRMLTA